MSDPNTKALKRLCASTPGGYKAVAASIDAHPMTLYQVIMGIKHTSGRVRSLGPEIRDRLTKRYPDWLRHLDTSEMPASLVVEHLAKILMKVPDSKRPEMERLLANLARAPDSSILLRTLVRQLKAYEHLKSSIQ